MNKAQRVEAAYDDAAWDMYFSSEGCYKEAVDTARKLGGIEVYNSNDDSSWSYTPTRTFQFNDSSSVYVMYGGVCVIEPY